jgi:V8-like Glu-specific endopeptidase
MKLSQLATASMLMFASNFFPTKAQNEIEVDVYDVGQDSLHFGPDNEDSFFDSEEFEDNEHRRQLTIFQPDDRVEYSPVKFQRGVGLLRYGKSNYCTATLVNRELILTAAKCLYRDVHDSTGKVVRRELLPNLRNLMRFNFGFTDGHRGAHNSLLKKIVVPNAFKNVDANWTQHNYAIVQLEKALGDATGFMHIKPRKPQSYDGLSVSLVSFMYKGNTTASADYCCEIIGVAAKRVKHTCDTANGANGAPLFEQRKGKKPGTFNYVLIAMHNEAGVNFNLAATTPQIYNIFKFAKDHIKHNPQYTGKSINVSGDKARVCKPTASPTRVPTRKPAGKPTTGGGEVPTTSKPTVRPSPTHTHRPTLQPFSIGTPPTTGGGQLTNKPTSWPTRFYTNSPTRPTRLPTTSSPTQKPVPKTAKPTVRG